MKTLIKTITTLLTITLLTSSPPKRRLHITAVVYRQRRCAHFRRHWRFARDRRSLLRQESCMIFGKYIFN
jgi:hypothetical protein